MANESQLARLQSLRFGDDVAEHDANLDHYFLKTNAYWSVVQDEFDLVLGAKGTGKSAIARFLSTKGSQLAELEDVEIIPARSTSREACCSSV